MPNSHALRVAAIVVALSVMSCVSASAQDSATSGIEKTFANPPQDCRPQTRWWWMGNALTKDDISRQLEEMHAQGIGGVEQITMDSVYEKGNIDYLSPQYFELLRHAIAEAHRLHMTVSVNFGGPGWVWGGDWIPASERNQTLLSSSFTVSGPVRVEQALSLECTINPRDVPRSCRSIQPKDRLIAVVAGRVAGDTIDANTLQVITEHATGRNIAWDAPDGTWRIMAFWSTLPRDGNAVNHIDKTAMEHYVAYLGQKYTEGLGEPLGDRLESLFGDSFEVPIHRNGIYWCDSLPAAFQSQKGYDLVRYLPALWWNIGEETPKVRYDINDALRRAGMEAFFDTFGAWSRAHGVKTRVQPYGFVTDNIEGAGVSDIPEMEITAGEKDAVPWFDTRIGPRDYVASGAHIYGRNTVSVEAYTYLHWQPYRATLEELKITSDMFLRSGANRFNNHGFIASPETGIAPTRGFYAAIHISPDNVWWPYYHLLSDYIARCCHVLRQGAPHADVAVYSPLANQWSLDAFNAPRWTRDFDWGDLGGLLISNGYNFDLVNDDGMQRLTKFDGQTLGVGKMAYGLLILPNVTAMPLETLKRVEQYVAQGGVVIALERVPDASCGMRDWREADREVQAMAATLFEEPRGRDDAGKHPYGHGVTYWLKKVINRSSQLDWRSAPLDPFLKVIQNHVKPDIAIDLVQEGMRTNNGLCFIHRVENGCDYYFVSNVRDRPVDFPVTFHVSGATPTYWDPYTGRIDPVWEFEERDGGIRIPLRLAPYQSTIVVFEHRAPDPHATATSLAWVDSVDAKQVTGWADTSGEHWVAVNDGARLHAAGRQVPGPLRRDHPLETDAGRSGLQEAGHRTE